MGAIYERIPLRRSTYLHIPIPIPTHLESRYLQEIPIHFLSVLLYQQMGHNEISNTKSAKTDMVKSNIHEYREKRREKTSLWEMIDPHPLPMHFVGKWTRLVYTHFVYILAVKMRNFLNLCTITKWKEIENECKYLESDRFPSESAYAQGHGDCETNRNEWCSCSMEIGDNSISRYLWWSHS